MGLSLKLLYDSYYGSVAGDVVGWRFTVTEQIEVSDLGVWNNDKTGGLESPHEVGTGSTPALLRSLSIPE
jgi:hypothetical protein